ncbi:SpoIVB peptidase [Lucifera butyrica]|nr:SpoIVB peptidase [Lucifera butyrica]
MTRVSKRFVGIGIAVLIVAFCLSPQFRSIYSLPSHMRIIEGENAIITVSFPLTIKVDYGAEAGGVKDFFTGKDFSRPVSFEPVKIGKTEIKFQFLGIIPLRSVEVDVLPPIKLIPGGHSIGVILHSQGVIVVGNSPVPTANGQYAMPAKEAGVSVGDVILSINGTPVHSDTQVAEIIDENGKKDHAVDLLIKRGNQKLQMHVTPVLCSDTKRFRIGLFVRDSAAGVGTLTFYDPHSRIYGALGHIITDSDTNQPIDCDQGKIILATVSGIQQGKRGQPGEKIGTFIDDNELLGDIQKNTPFGIYGQMFTPLKNELYSDGVSVASMSQVHTGPAEMLTVVDNQKIERFSIDIEKVNLQEYPEGKGLVIKVTDPRLLAKTGGIVQGMSGSPILQNNKLVGAVTHVFVHDPTKGYGCFIDWMLMESGIIPKKERQSARKLFTLSGRFFLDQKV